VHCRLARVFADRRMRMLEIEPANDPTFPQHWPPGACVVMAHDAGGIGPMNV
jgi:hypothetical protein